MPAAIADHALLSDCQSAALVTRAGAIDWWPAPRFDSPSAFSALLDDDAGHWTIRPDEPFRASWEYRPGTLVLETTLRCASGTMRVTDALLLAPAARGHEIGLVVGHALARHVEVLDGELTVCMECAPKLEYGLAVPRMQRDGDGAATIGGSERVFVRGTAIEIGGSSVSARVRLAAGEDAAWIVHRAAGMYARTPAAIDPRRALDDTTAAWRSWSDAHAGYEGVHAQRVRFSSLVFQGLTYQPTGALVAAATTSLPEIAGGEDNWDYRYGWLRDAAMVVRALGAAACDDESRRYFDWIVRAAVTCRAEEQVQIVFGVDGERDLSEHRLEHLDGHRGSRPVRVGNAAWRQKQLDVLGHVLDAAWVIRDDLGTPDAFTARFLCQLADRAAKQWREPDSGIWEGREGERHYLVSKVGCWVALDRAVRLAERLDAGAACRRWAAERDELRALLLREGFDERRGAFTGALGSDRLDAGVLLLPLLGFVEPGDPRMTSTIALLEDELGDGGGLIRRWTGAEDSPFLPACFWLAECHARAGRLERAHEVFEQAAGAATDLGLLAEEVDPARGEPLGNFPQAISHVGLVNAAGALTHAEAQQGASA